MKLFILISILFFKNMAFASEDSWTPTSLKLTNSETKVPGFVTDKGSFRISELPQFSTKIFISGGYFSNSSVNAAALCSTYGNSLRATKLLSKNKYTFKAEIYPFADNLISAFPVYVENVPAFGNAVVSLKINPNSIVTTASASDFEKRMTDIINLNIESLKKTGSVTFELSQIDDVVCDLILGQSTLTVNFAVRLEMAKHSREVIISGSEFSKVYEDVKSRSTKPVATIFRSTVNGGLLDQALRNQIGKTFDDYGTDKFMRIANVVFNSDSGFLQTLSKDQYDEAARSIDILRQNSSLVTLQVKLTPKIGSAE